MSPPSRVVMRLNKKSQVNGLLQHAKCSTRNKDTIIAGIFRHEETEAQRGRAFPLIWSSKLAGELGGRFCVLRPDGQVAGRPGPPQQQKPSALAAGTGAGPTNTAKGMSSSRSSCPARPQPEHAGLLWEALGSREEELGRTRGKLRLPRERKTH